MTHQTTIKAEMVAMRVVGMTTTVGRATAAMSGTTTTTMSETTTAETTTIITVITAVTGLSRVATGITVMAITISAITSENAIYAIASTKELTIVHPTKAIVVWNMILPTALRV